MAKTTQEKIFGYIQSHLEERQIPPTLRDIQEHFGFSAIGTVQYHLKNLAKSGLLDIRPRLSRGITLTAKATGIPILGRVPAGPAQLAFEEVEGYLPSTMFQETGMPMGDSTPTRSAPSSETLRGLFALRIKGDSMVEAGILDGDLVVVRPQSSGKNGDIVVARLGEEDATVKRLVRKPGLIQLSPANSKYQPIPVNDDTKIIGKVVRVVRQYS